MDNKEQKMESSTQSPIMQVNQEENIVQQNKEEPKPTNNTINNNVDFNSIFNVESEEKVDLPVKKEENSSAMPVVSSEEQNVETVEKKEEKTKPKENMFNGNERLLYEIKPEKEGNPIVVVLFFLLLFLTILALPSISKKVSFYFSNPNVETTPSTTEEEEEFYYFNKSSVRATMGDLEFTNFVKYKEQNEYSIKFMVSNTSQQPYQFDKKYYIVLYNNDTLVYRALIHSYEAIGSLGVSEVKAIISEKSYKEANRFKIQEITESQYPSVKLTEEDGDYQVMTCKYNNDEIKYYFLEGKLASLKETYNEDRNSFTNYENDLIQYRNLSLEYKKINNFQSTFIEDSTSFTMINTIDHKEIPDATLSNLKTYKFFKYNETKEVVSFELEAQGYTCS